MIRRLAPEILLLAGLAFALVVVYACSKDSAVLTLAGGALAALYGLIKYTRRQRRAGKTHRTEGS